MSDPRPGGSRWRAARLGSIRAAVSVVHDLRDVGEFWHLQRVRRRRGRFHRNHHLRVQLARDEYHDLVEQGGEQLVQPANDGQGRRNACLQSLHGCGTNERLGRRNGRHIGLLSHQSSEQHQCECDGVWPDTPGQDISAGTFSDTVSATINF